MKKHTFKGGVRPPRSLHEGKVETAGKAIRALISDTVCIPMDMHIGAPSVPCVKKGDRVLMGQVIGEPSGALGVPVHASVSGQVTDIGIIQQLQKTASTCITITNDFADEWVPLSGHGDVETIPVEAIVPAIRDAGIVGMGGAAFPTHVKLSPPADKRIDTILINGSECETFITSDHRLMLEYPDKIVNGMRAAMRATGAKRGIIAIEDNKMDAVVTMQKAIQGREGAEVAVLRTKYPQGGEKQMIQAVLGREVPSGGLPMDIGAIVLNVGTAAAIADAIIDGKPLISRVATVAGKVREPSNLLLRIGTIVMDAFDGCGGFTEEPGKIFVGGSMMGIAVPNERVSATKGTNGIVALGEKEARSYQESPCIRCGRCITGCPSGLKPYRLNELYGLRDWEGMDKEHMLDCILCGTCSFVCPARRWLVASFHIGKEEVTQMRIANEIASQAALATERSNTL